MKVNDYEYISEQDFDAVWGAHAKSNGDLYHHSEIRSLPLEHVWTVSEGDDVDEDGFNLDNNWYASPGAHVVNALGYLVTVKAWGEGTPDAIWCLGEEEHARQAQKKGFL